MPSPERLGVGRSRPANPGLDWSSLGGRLQQVGATGCHMDRVAGGGFRFTCWLPGAQAGVSQRVEATAATEDEAVRLALERAAQARAGRP
jgi:hypothetical protein